MFPPFEDFAPEPEALASDPSSVDGIVTGMPRGILKVLWSDYWKSGTFDTEIASLMIIAETSPTFGIP